MIDSHAHVDGREFDGDRAEVLARARAAGVSPIVTIGTGPTLADIGRAVALARAEPDVWATVGVHPHDAARIGDGWWDQLEIWGRDPRVVGIGETGLDFYYDHSPREAQAAAFRRHVALARRLRKPVVCHVRDAHAETLAILREEGATGGIIHCFTGLPDDASAYVTIDFYVSFSGIVTFKTAGALREAVRRVPLDRLLIETDCPYLAPVPMRGKRNEPAYLVHTAEVVAREAGVSSAELAAATEANARRAFGLTGGPGEGK
ncbi:MAG TPA: TatD family hydrolase [Haliangiales bacterium]|nr:TatD family hydrolase [Haliangiales bacterium]